MDRFVAVVGRVEPRWLSGRFDDAMSGERPVSLSFFYRGPDKWRVERNGKVSEVTNGTRTVVVKDGSVRIYNDEHVVVNNVLKSFVLSKKFVDQEFLESVQGRITRSTKNGRETWIFRLGERADKPSTVIEMDASTGVFISMEAGPRKGTLTELDFHHAPDESLFEWKEASGGH